MSAQNKKYTPEPVSSRPTYIIGGLAIVVIAALVFGGIWWQSSKNKVQNEGYGSVQNSEVVVTVQANGVVLLGKPDARTTLDIFEDPLCPACAALEHLSGQAVAEAIDNGDIAVRYHMLNFLNKASSSGDYSTRAGAALMCVAQDGNAIAYSRLHTALFSPDNQPAESGKSDHSNDELASLATENGASPAAATCISSGVNVEAAAANAAAASEALSAAGSTGTPTVVADGKIVSTKNSDWVSQFTS
ncbi:DsbA family protein [Rhodococcus sp. IEGM 1379]|uniref:DsbA family protein n=1 Tax=Rhodococcus sp. IEGM 1379 TaxID=3047086 RepID=UPI0024B77897|nr:DsbA family protein [Rhodococcus sp. IEGM 1379]MDI9917934.1 DsbA family protein [Rhodococcus sp. IEGM 1379]